MILENGNDHRPFEQKLTKLRLILEKLASFHRGSKIIWMNQYPTVDYFGPTGVHNTMIYNEKLVHYNAIVRHAFKYIDLYLILLLLIDYFR